MNHLILGSLYVLRTIGLDHSCTSGLEDYPILPIPIRGHRDLLDGRLRGEYVTIFGKFFNKDKSVSRSIRNTRHKKCHEICTLCEVVAAQLYYSYGGKIANQWPLLGEI